MAGHEADLSSLSAPPPHPAASNEAVVDMDPCGGIHYLAAVNCELILFNTHGFSAVGLVTEQTYNPPLLLNKSHL